MHKFKNVVIVFVLLIFGLFFGFLRQSDRSKDNTVGNARDTVVGVTAMDDLASAIGRLLQHKTILTANDLDSDLPMVSDRADQDAFYIQVHPDLPELVVHVQSFHQDTPGQITVFAVRDLYHPLQTIVLETDMFLRDKVPMFFQVHDVNFDGYLDIGVIYDGGATWAAYQFWIYEKELGRFVTSELTDDIKKIGSNTLKFDDTRHEITAYYLRGGWQTYTVEQGRTRLIEDQRSVH